MVMEQQQNHTNEPLRDVFATQGILVVLVGILICVLHLLAPVFCGELLHEWHELAAQSPTPDALAAQVTAWFASIFAA